jgi:hypothetical protein
MRKTGEQSAKGYDRQQSDTTARDTARSAREGKAKESGAHYGKKNTTDLKSYAREGKAKESGAHYGKKNTTDLKSYAKEGKAKESGSDYSKNSAGACTRDTNTDYRKDDVRGPEDVVKNDATDVASDNVKTERTGWGWIEEFMKKRHEGMLKRLDSPGNTAAAQYRADVASGKEKYVSLEDFIKQTSEEYLERAKKS